MSTIGDDLLRESSPAFGPKIEALVVYNSNPVAVAPESPKVVQGFRARGPVHRGARALHDRHRRPRRLRAAGHHAARAPRRAHQLRPHLRDDQRAGDRAARRGASPTRRSFASWRARMGFDEPCFADSDETLARAAFTTRRRLRRAARATAGSSCRCPRRRSPTAASPRPSGKCIVDSPGFGVPDHVPNYESARSSPRARARYPLAMISPPARNFLNSSFVNVHEPARHRRRAAARDARRRRRARAASPTAQMVRVFNDRGELPLQARVLSARARPGVVNGLGVWWRKLGVRRHQRQRAHAPAPDRHRPRAGVLRLPGRGAAGRLRCRVRRWLLMAALRSGGAAVLAAGRRCCLTSGCSNARLLRAVGRRPPRPAAARAAGARMAGRRPHDAAGAEASGSRWRSACATSR